MTPTIAQRLGLRPVVLRSRDRRSLLAARAAAISFVTLGSLVVVAAAAGGDLGRPALVAGAAAGCAAIVLVCCYERLPRSVNRLIAFAGTLIVTELALFQPSGELYAPLYLGIVLYVSMFFSRLQATIQVGAAIALWALVGISIHSFEDAAQIWILGAGLLVGAAAVTRVMRDHLVRAVQDARSQRALFDAFFRHAPAGFGVLDHDLQHVRVNQALADLMALRRDEIEGGTLREVAPFNADILEPLAQAVARSGEPMLGIEIESPEGQSHLVSYYPLPGVGVGTAVMDVTHLKDVERRLEETNRRLTVLATTDELTGLPNRRLLAEQLDLALARARRAGTGVAVLCLDLDRFKDVNDTLGHSYGDDMLVAVAEKLRAGARDTDVVARLGGDEFVVLLADLDVQGAPELVETVVERIHGLLAEPVAIGPVELKVEASVGVAIYPLDSRDAKGLLAAADAAMYAGKSPFTRVA